MLLNASILAVLTTVAWVLSYKRLPRRVRKFLEKHHLFTDIITAVLTYWTLGGTLVALLAAAICSLLVDLCLNIVNHKNDYLWLYAALDEASKAVTKMKDGLNSWAKNINQEYKLENGIV